MKRILAAGAFLFLSVLGICARSGKETVTDGVFLRQIQQRDSILIADQLKYGVRLGKVEDGSRLLLPQWKDTVTAGVDIVRGWTVDTVKVYKATKSEAASADLEAYLVITSFDDGLFDLPPLEVTVVSPEGEENMASYPYQQLVVKTIPVDTSSFEVHDIKGQIRYPLTFGEAAMYAGIFLGALALIAGIVLLVIRLRKRKEGENQYREPAHIVALRKLDKLRGDKFWEPEKQKFFYSGVTDALREYIDSRYEVSAMEMTTAEIFGSLKKTDIPAEFYEPLKELFERADFIKFAKHIADKEENATVLPLAVRFVSETYQQEVEDDSKIGE